VTQPSQYPGLPVSEGMAAGQLYPGDTPGGPSARAASPEELRDAFAAVAQERSALAQRLRERGRDDQAEIVAIGALMAADPALVDPAVAAVRDGADAATAVGRSAAAQAAALAALANPDLAARADDVRQVANAVLARLAGDAAPLAPPATGFILVRREVDPADLIRLAETGLAGAVSVSGGASSHAAIIARGLGVPMLAGVDPAVLAAPAGHPAILDAGAGRLIVDPSPAQLAAVAARAQATPPGANGVAGRARRGGGAPASATPPRTADGQEVTLLCNVASAAETRLGLAAGAAGVGLLRTEIPFVSGAGWPTEADHQALLGPVMSLLAGRPVVVRLLDFSGDKVPAFLAGREAGLTALIRHPRALRDQFRAILRTGRDTRLGVMVPMVRTLDEMALVRTAMLEAAAEVGTEPPELGMMVEVASTAAAAQAFASRAEFFSIGTNDLTSQVLGLGRADHRTRPALAADPRVLALVSHVVRVAGATGVKVSVCGDAAADPAVLPLLIGLGVRTFSVGAASVSRVADWIATADTSVCAALAAGALQAAPAGQVGAQVKAP
jgi:phosphoenolpyruvate-protein kinase (PTS system EI component)